jgi:hypothetical protein
MSDLGPAVTRPSTGNLGTNRWTTLGRRGGRPDGHPQAVPQRQDAACHAVRTGDHHRTTALALTWADTGPSTIHSPYYYD